MDTIHLSNEALENIRFLQKEMEAEGFGLRFGYTGGGCSGHKYIIEFENEPDEDDLIFKFEDLQVFVKEEHMGKLKNSTINWKESLMESGFEIDNPQAKRACGCGESVDLSQIRSASMTQATTTLTVELVPATAWGANLRSILEPSHWDQLRRASYRKAKYRCEICGGKGPKHPVECHEIWHYDDKKHIQTLKGLISLCPNCHQVKHIGHAHLIGKGQDAREHLQRCNQWSPSEVAQYLEQVFAQWEERSQFEWQLDLSWLNDVQSEIL